MTSQYGPAYGRDKSGTIQPRVPAYGTPVRSRLVAMSTPPPEKELPVRRIDRILAFMSLGMVVLSILCFVSIMIGSASGMQHEDFGTGLWPTIGIVVYIAPVIAFLLMMAVIVMTFARRARANKGR